MPTREQLVTLCGVAGFAASVVTAGWAGAGEVVGVKVLAGDVQVDEGELVLGPGAAIGLGDGTSLQATGTYPGREVDLGRGPLDGAHVYAHFGAVSGLYHQDGSTMGDDPRSRWTPPPGRTTLELTCDRMVWVREDNRVMSRASPERPCVATPLWVRAAGEARLSGLTRDGQPVRWGLTGFAWEPAVGVSVVCLVTGGLIGLDGMFMLLPMPLALLGPQLGVPVEAGMLLVAASAGIAAAAFGRAWRRWTALGLGVLGLGLAARVVNRDTTVGSRVASLAVGAAVDIGLVQRKVDEVLARVEPELVALPPDAKVIFALGSSSSGGGTAGRFWPDILAERMPGYRVVSLAQGGATTWHERRVIEALSGPSYPKPTACVLYMGQNDTTASMPGLTIAELARGEKPKSTAWVTPETTEDSRENVVAIAARCPRTLVMAEYVRGREAPLAAFGAMLQTVPGVRYLDPTPTLTAAPGLMLDDVHPSPVGQEALAERIAGELAGMMGGGRVGGRCGRTARGAQRELSRDRQGAGARGGGDPLPTPTQPLGRIMNGTRELPPLNFDVTMLSTTTAFVWDPKWYTTIGVPSVDLNLDVRAVMVGGGAVSLKPAIQYAPVRTDRPDEGALITAGSAVTTNGVSHYQETMATATKFFWRRGVGYQLTSGAFSRANGLLYTAFRPYGEVLPAEEIVVNPTNDVSLVSYYPLGGGLALPATGVDLARVVVILLDNLNTAMQWRIAGRAFNDPMARGGWTDLMSGWQSTTAGDSEVPPADISLSGLSLPTKQWFELALAVRKATDGAQNSRCIFRVIPGIKFT